MSDHEMLPRPPVSVTRGRRSPRTLALEATGPRIAAGTGKPLDPDAGRALSPLVGADLTGVRLHTDAFAADLTAGLDAEVVTQGRDVFFSPTGYGRDTTSGHADLADELSHVLPTDVAARPAVARQPGGPAASAVEGHAPGAPLPLPGGAGSDRPTALAIGDGLAQFVTRMIQRDGTDHSGQVRALLARLDDELRRSVMEQVSERGGAVAEQLRQLIPLPPPAPSQEVPVEPANSSATPEEPSEAEVFEDLEEQAEAIAPLPEERPGPEDWQSLGDQGAAEQVADEQAPPAAAISGPPARTTVGPLAPVVPPAGDAAGATAVTAVDAGGVASVSAAGSAAAIDAGPLDAPLGVSLAETPGDVAAGPIPAPVPEAGAEPMTDTVVAEPEPVPDTLPEPAPDPALEPVPDTALEPAPEPVPDTLPEPAPEAPAATEPEAEAIPAHESSPPADLVSDMAPPVEAAPAGRTESVPAVAAQMDSEAAGPEVEESADAPQLMAAPVAADRVPTLADPLPPSGGGGGGGSAIPDPPRPAPPDVSGMPPATGLAAVASLPASTISSVLPSVGAAVQAEIAAESASLTANPPSMKRPSGAPADKDASEPPAPLPPVPENTRPMVPELEGGSPAVAPVPVDPPAAPAPVTAQVPDVAIGGDDPVSPDDAARVQGAVQALPTSDPALYVDAGPVPDLELQGREDPAQVGRQAAELDHVVADTASAGLQDARTPMGENTVFPHVPDETLVATLPEAAPPTSSSRHAAPAPYTAGGGNGPAGPASAWAVDAIAAEQSGGQVAGAAMSQSEQLIAARAEHDHTVESERANTDKAINDEIAANAQAQTATRRRVRTDVAAERTAWVDEQRDLTARTRTAADQAQHTAADEVSHSRTKARTDAVGAIQHGNEQIAQKRSEAESTARSKRHEAEVESQGGGFFSWVASKVERFFTAIKEAIHTAFELARQAVDLAIQTAQQAAVDAIDLGRRTIVAAIETGGKGLTAAGDIALAGFPRAREAFRAKIETTVEGATETVNDLAGDLKKGVTRLLDLLGQALNAALRQMEKLYTSAIDAVAGVVNSVIAAAQRVADTMGAFLAIAGDIAADPLAWLKNLGAGMSDGVRNHVWPALVTAVKTWFRNKVEGIVGVGAALMGILRQGGVSFGHVVSMAWTAIKESLPGVLIQILVEKLVAMLIPAAGALSVIVDGIRAAWGASQRILAAFQKFMDFLKVVKTGRSGPAFGDLVGAAAVAVIDFVSNFVLIRLKGAGAKVGGALRKIAATIQKGAKRAAGAVKTGAKATVGAARRGGKAAVQAGKTALRKGAELARKVTPKNMGQRGAKAGRAVASTVSKGTARIRSGLDKVGKKTLGKKTPRKPKESREQKIQRAMRNTTAAVDRLARSGVSRLRWLLTLKWLKARYGWKQLEFRRTSGGAEIRGKINPDLPMTILTPKMEIRSTNGSVVVGSWEVLKLEQLLTVNYGKPGNSRRPWRWYEEALSKIVKKVIALASPFEDTEKMVIDTPTERGPRFSDEKIIRIHEQWEFRKGSEKSAETGEMLKLRNTKGDWVVESPEHDSVLLVEGQLISDLKKRSRTAFWTWMAERFYLYGAEKYTQLPDRLRKVMARMDENDFIEEASKARARREKAGGMQIPKRRTIYILFLCPEKPTEGDPQSMTESIKRHVQKVAEERLTNKREPIYVEVKWIETGGGPK